MTTPHDEGDITAGWLAALAVYTYEPHIGGNDRTTPYQRERDACSKVDDYTATRRLRAWQRNHGLAS